MKSPGKLGIAFVAVIAVVVMGCTSSGKTAKTGQSLGQALTLGVKFDKGVLKHLALPKANSAGQKLQLLANASKLTMKPGASSIMPMDVDNPDQDTHPVEATLMQFDDSNDSIEVPTKGKTSAGSADAGSSADSLVHIENAFSVADDICKLLCNSRFTSHVTITVRLDNGGICQHGTQDIELDCTKDGDPDLCSGSSGSTKDAGAKHDAGSKKDSGADAAAAAAGKGGSSGSSGKGGTGGAAASDAGPASSDGAPGVAPPQVAAISPDTTPADTALTLSITGTGFLESAVVYFNDVAIPTTFVSGTELSAEVSASINDAPGTESVYVANKAGDLGSESNVLYLHVDQVTGAPVIYDYSPDNGLAGDKILIIASNLAGQTLDIKDAAGNVIAAGALATLSWPTAGTADTVEITLPAGIVTGPFTVGNALGSYKGKIFTVGSNLTRTAGTVLDSWTQFNTTNWSRASGGDNQLATSFFTADDDCATDTSCTTKPWFKITFASAQTVGRIAMRGNREYQSGYDFINGKFEVLGANDSVLWTGTYALPLPDRDLDIRLPAPIANALSVKFSGLVNESVEPGFSELEVFGP